MNYILISIIAYALNAGSTIIDKILLAKSVPNPLVYVFYINVLGILAIFLFPFGVKLEFESFFVSAISGLFFVVAIYFFFKALKEGEASVAAPVVGSLNPLFSILLGSIFLSQAFTSAQYLAFFIILLGTAILTADLWITKIKLNSQLTSMALSGLCFALSYLLIREVFLMSNFLTGLTYSRLTGSALVLSLLFFPSIRGQIFGSHITSNHFANRTSVLLASGQIMGGVAGLLINYAISLANPALVNALFGAQYLVILVAANLLARKHPKLLEEKLSPGILIKKTIGALVLSLGVYLLGA